MELKEKVRQTNPGLRDKCVKRKKLQGLNLWSEIPAVFLMLFIDCKYVWVLTVVPYCYFTEVLRSIRKVMPDTTMERARQHSTHWYELTPSEKPKKKRKASLIFA